MKFFRLNEGCFIVDGTESSCIYNTISGQMITVNNQIANILKKCECNEDISNIDSYTYNILLNLQKLNVGNFYKKPIYIEKLTTYDVSKIEAFSKSNFEIKDLFIELTNKCNIDCIFCGKNDSTLFRKTGCKRWPLNELNIRIDRLKEIIYQAKNIGCENIFFTGGEPLLEWNYIKELVTYSKKIGIKNNTILTNGLMLNDEIINFFNKNEVKLIIQIYSFNNEIYKKITGKDDLASILIKNIKKLKHHNINFSLNLLVNKFNENNIEDTLKEYSHIVNGYEKSNISMEYIYPNGGNEFYSNKYYKNMLDKTKSLSKVYLNNLFSNKNKHNCYGYQLAITGDGQVLPCIMSRNIILGNIFKDDLIDILKKKEYKEVASITKDSINKCNKCELKYGCFDCRALEQSASGDLYGIKYCNR